MKEKFRLFGRDSTKEKFLCGFAAALFPTVIFVYFCAQNIYELILWAAVILSLVVFLLAVVGYLFSLIIFKKSFSALVFCSVCWLGVYLEPIFLSYVLSPLHLARKNSTVTTFVIIMSAYCIAKLMANIRKTMKLTYLFTAMLIVVLVINTNIFLHSFMKESKAYKTDIPIKTGFVTDFSKKAPNVYWVHADGMLGIDAVEKYYGDKQEKFLNALAKRGFLVNPHAHFEAAHQTQFAIPILINPYSYDNWISHFTRSHESAFTLTMLSYHFRIMRMNGELQNAFATKGYDINVTGGYGYYYPASNGKFYPVDAVGKVVPYQKMFDNGVMGLRNTLNNIREISSYFRVFSRLCWAVVDKFWTVEKRDWDNYHVLIDNEQLEKMKLDGWDESSLSLEFVMALYDILHGNYPTPRLTILNDLTAHRPFIYSQDGIKIKDGDNRNPLDYHPQHIWSGKVLINVVDMILEVDSDAVIVIQADHGLHGNTEEDFKKAFGEEANPIELWNSTMSAIRVPEKYRTGEEHYAMENPLNISRYLVNSFVGKNYDYLPANSE